MERNNLIFILGRNSELSVAEIKAVFEKNGWAYKLVIESKEILIVETENALPEVLHKTLGGTVKIGQVEKISSSKLLEEDLSVDFLLSKIFPQTGGKIQFGISVYNGGDSKQTEFLASKINTFSKGIKALLEQKQISARFAFNRDRFLSSVAVDKNKLIQKGAEILFIPCSNKIFIGKTLYVQEFEEFSARDYSRPARDLKSGIMPPKLARMMINLAEIHSNGILLDPFCGSGTVLQEAVLLGYKNIVGRDNSQKAVADTKTNLEWLFKNIVEKHNLNIDVKFGDATKLPADISAGSVSGIVTEPYLGPTLHGQLFPEKLQSITQELKNLYLAAFSGFNKVLEPHGVVVMILPAFVQKNRVHFLDILPEIEKLGFVQEKISDSVRGTVAYGNKYNFVLREIVKFRKP